MVVLEGEKGSWPEQRIEVIDVEKGGSLSTKDVVDGEGDWHSFPSREFAKLTTGLCNAVAFES